jgi:hypothetical protein
MSRGGAPRILTFVAVVTMIVAVVGVVVSMIAGAFSDEYQKYGEVPIPGSGHLQLEAGQVTVTFHTVLVGGSGSGLPLPPIKYRITGPGGEDVELTEDSGGTTTVNNDARRRVGYLHVPTTGTYDVELGGNVSAFLNPTLAFGRDGGYGVLPIVFSALLGFAIVVLVIARIWAARVRRRGVAAVGTSQSYDYVAPPSYGTPSYPPPPTYVPPPADPYTPNEQGIRIEQLNNIARLRDSGALTQDEFETEKKRILGGS